LFVGYRRREPPASPELIQQLEQHIGQSLPTSYRTYLLQQDGGRLTNNHEVVKTIFGLGNVPAWANMWEALDTFHNRMPVWLLPVADDEFGNLFAISLRSEDLGSVWFWDHEKEADEGELPTEDNLELKATDWFSFLDSLQPLQ
jgi:cell wall assembly regulator SMI1